MADLCRFRAGLEWTAGTCMDIVMLIIWIPVSAVTGVVNMELRQYQQPWDYTSAGTDTKDWNWGPAAVETVNLLR